MTETEDRHTRRPRVVRLTANEASTLDRDRDPIGHNNHYACVACGHLGLLHTNGERATFCNVLECECETWGPDSPVPIPPTGPGVGSTGGHGRWLLALIVLVWAAAMILILLR